MEVIPLTLMIHRCDLFGFAFTSESGSKTKTPILKKANVRCMVQDAKPDIITFYYQRQELVTQTVYFVDQRDFDAIAINDRIVFKGKNYRIAGRHNFANLDRVFAVDVREEM